MAPAMGAGIPPLQDPHLRLGHLCSGPLTFSHISQISRPLPASCPLVAGAIAGFHMLVDGLLSCNLSLNGLLYPSCDPRRALGPASLRDRGPNDLCDSLPMGPGYGRLCPKTQVP
jgi:hypothetical protein